MRRCRLILNVLVTLRRWLSCAITSIGLVRSLSFMAFPLLGFLPFMVLSSLLSWNGFRIWSSELRWIQEQAPSWHLKVQSAHFKIKKVLGVNICLDFRQLWKAPSSPVLQSPSSSCRLQSAAYGCCLLGRSMNSIRGRQSSPLIFA